MKDHMPDDDFVLRLKDWRLLTAEILYHLPDHPKLLQSFTWQTMDVPPRFPRLIRFLDFWTREIDGVLHSVSIMHDALVKPAEYRFIDHQLRLN